MSLPPDPHDDDVAGYDTPPPPPPPPAGPDDAPPPAGGARGAPDPTPGSLASGVQTQAPSGSAPAPPPPVPPHAAPSTPSGPDSSADGRDPAGAAGSGRRRLAPLLAGAAALVVVVAGAVVVFTGSDDAETATPASEQPPPEAEDADDADETDEPSAGPADEAGEIGGTADGAVDGGESPVEVAEAFFAAVEESDCTGVVSRLTPESYGSTGASAAEAIADCEDDGEGTSAVAEANWDDIALVSEDGDEATVSVTVSVGTEEAIQELPMRRIDGEWLMDFDTTATAPLG